MSEKTVRTGAKIDDFVLPDQHGNDFDSGKREGKKLLLSFHPLAWTSVCREQMKRLEAKHGEFEALNTVPLGISVDAQPSKKAWADSMELKKLKILADFWPHGKLAEDLGIFMDDKGFSKRVNIIVDENNEVLWSRIYPIKEVPDFDEVLEILKG